MDSDLFYYDESSFRSSVDRALNKVRTILENTRSPQFAADVPHKYDDKYGLAEFLTNISLAAQLNALEALGLQEDGLRQLLEWAQDRSVTLRLRAEEKCVFDREETRKVESATEYVTEYESQTFGNATRTDKVITKITEYFWKFDFEYELFAYRGSDPSLEDGRLVLQTRSGRAELKTTGKASPCPETYIPSSPSLNITWLLQQVDPKTLQLKFKIDRTSKKCRTPRRNPEVEEALRQQYAWRSWANEVSSYFRSGLLSGKPVSYPMDMGAINASMLFVPIMPLLEEGATKLITAAPAPAPKKTPVESPVPGSPVDSIAKSLSAAAMSTLKVPGAGTDSSSDESKSPRKKDKEKDKKDKDKKKGGKTPRKGEEEAPAEPVTALPAISTDIRVQIPGASSDTITAVLPIGDANNFLYEQKRSMLEKFAELDKVFGTQNKLLSIREAVLLVVIDHLSNIASTYANSVQYIEQMLHNQLVSAIGKEVGPVDFANYMRFHNRKLFKSQYEPQPFCYAIRRPDHSPEGVITIEAQQHDGTIADPIFTNVRHIPASASWPMQFPINAATNVVFNGDRYLHGWIQHSFSGDSGSSVSLVARARQFSSYILMVGRIASATVFDPKAAIIIQNKDDLKIPLLLETIPTPKEFRDAIESMSPEQQRFCKAFRAMQLESTLFGICVVQIKPQLEKLLNLKDDSLTKEIRLTQDLLELFIKYQIPSDLLKFDGRKEASAEERLSAVKAQVTAMQEMLDGAKQKEIHEAAQEFAYNNMNEILLPPSPPSPRRPIPIIAPEPLSEPDYIIERPQKQSFISKLISKFGGSKKGSSKDYESSSIDRSMQSERKKISSRSRDYEDMSYAINSAPMMASESSAPVLMSAGLADFDISPSYEAMAPVAKSVSASAPAPFPPSEAIAPAPPADGSAVAPAATPTPAADAQKKTEPQYDVTGTNAGMSDVKNVEDFTKVPGQLDKKFEQLDEDASLRPTILNIGTTWTKKFQKALLADPESQTLDSDEQKTERNRAFDLMDALSRSGSLAFDCAELHVVIASTHCFDKSLINTVVQDNVNPIEKVERSCLIVATTIHGDKPAAELVKSDQLERVSTYSANLFPAIEAAKK